MNNHPETDLIPDAGLADTRGSDDDEFNRAHPGVNTLRS